ncbi:MAG TPA: hypothetical protein VN372_03420 [Methanospirillum sp.]|nr:hypothetical protein [Methanospirillum sp.]
MIHEIRSALSTLFVPGQVIELRAIGENSIASGYFDDPEHLAEIAEKLNSAYEIGGVYVTLNTINPVLLARRANRIKMRLSKKDATTADTDIIQRNWLPIDIDPVRPSGVSSSEEEHQAALSKATIISSYLSEMGWPEPVIGDSGNGSHLLYRIDLPNTPESRDLVKGCLESLDVLFSDDRCHVDMANFNAARIWKLYGTISRKGDNTADRPHRRSRLITAPDTHEIVPISALRNLAGLFPRETDLPKKTRNGMKIHLGEWLDSHQISYVHKPYQGGDLFVLHECPFSKDHTDGAYAIQFPNGAIYAGCHHTSCGGGAQRWADLREHYKGSSPHRSEKDRDTRSGGQSRQIKQTRREQKKAILEEARSAPVAEITLAADSILREGNPLTFLLDTFNEEHEGDRVVAECLAMSLASRSVINSKGLHVSITGESGKGKSHTIDTMLQFIPPEFRIDGRMSDKALFYIENMRLGTVIALDDVFLSDQMQEILKGVTTSFQKDFTYHTVSKDRTGQVCTIPERCVWWVAKVEGSGDDQVFNRMLTCWIDDSDEQDQKVLRRALADAEKMPGTRPTTRREILIAQEMWLNLKQVWVVIPYASRIRFQNTANRRNPDMLLDLIKTNAALKQHQRESSMVDEMTCVIATREDFDEAARLFQALNGETGGQVTKLTRKEAELIDAIRLMDQYEMTITQLQKATRWSNSTINKLLHGYQSRGQSYSGLLEKCPAISFLDRTVKSDDDGLSTQRRTKVFTWDAALYESWAQGCSVWIEHDDTPSFDTDEHSGDQGGRAERKQKSEERAGGSAQIQDDTMNQIEKREEIYLDNTIRAERSERSEQVISSHDSVHDGHHDLRPSAQVPDRRPPRPPLPVPCTKTREEPSAHRGVCSALPLSDIRPSVFVPIEGWPDKKPCCVCGKTPTYYQERASLHRSRGSPHPNLMLCKKCFDTARRAESARFTALPGVIDTAPMVRRECDLGKCHICNTSKAVWWDGAEHLGLCEVCYARESRGQRYGEP